MDFASARAVADAVLYEGYLLYPYTASAQKNQMRWQFGVLVPQAYAQRGTGEPAHQQTEILVRPKAMPALTVLLRFLAVQVRTVEERTGNRYVPVPRLTVADNDYITWDEAVEQEVLRTISLRAPAQETFAIEIPAARKTEALRNGSGAVVGRVVRRRWALRGTLTVTTSVCHPEHASVPRSGTEDHPSGVEEHTLLKVRVRVENESDVVTGAERTAVLRTALVSTHVLLGVENGVILSLLDPPPFAVAETKKCVNEHSWPVLVGDAEPDEHSSRRALSSPIILYDFPTVAAQSDGDKFDATEIDELLNLSVLSLSDAEKREARATDSAARTIIDRAEALKAEELAAQHGRIEPEPGGERIVVRGTEIVRGSRVRLRPSRRADVWDAIVDGRTAHVAGVYRDMEDNAYVAVTVDDDPASEFHAWYGRSLFFHPDEIEPLEIHV